MKILSRHQGSSFSEPFNRLRTQTGIRYRPGRQSCPVKAALNAEMWKSDGCERKDVRIRRAGQKMKVETHIEVEPPAPVLKQKPNLPLPQWPERCQQLPGMSQPIPRRGSYSSSLLPDECYQLFCQDVPPCSFPVW